MNTPECCYLHKAIFTFEKGIRDYISLKVPNREDAEDLAQEVFLKISLAHARNEQIRNVKNWIFTLTNNTIAQHYREKYRSKEAPEDINHLGDKMEDVTSSWCACEFIRPLIDLLDEKYSVPLILSDFEKVPQGDVAEKLNLSLSATKSRIQRARHMLRELLFECTTFEYDKFGNVFSFEIKESCAPMRIARDELKKR